MEVPSPEACDGRICCGLRSGGGIGRWYRMRRWRIALRRGGGGGSTEAHLPNPRPPPSWAAVPGGGFGAGGALPAVPRGGGGSTPTSAAQNDPHVAPTILTTHMWGGDGGLEKNVFGPNFCVPAPLASTSTVTQHKGPGMEAHFSNPPSVPPPPHPRNGDVGAVTCGLLFETPSAQHAAHAVHKNEGKACREPENGPGPLSQQVKKIAPPPPPRRAIFSSPFRWFALTW